MWTYGTINLVVTLGVFGAGLVGFLAGWLAHRAAVREQAAQDAPHHHPNDLHPHR